MHPTDIHATENPTPDHPTPLGENLAAKLNHLFDTVRPTPGGRPYSNDAVVTSIAASGGPTLSKGYLSELRSGKKTNPTMKHLEALADFFHVAPAYFFDDTTSDHSDAELELRAALRDANVRTLALRASELSPDTLRAITAIVDNARAAEGKPTT